MWLHIKRKDISKCGSINMDHVTNVITAKKGDGHYEVMLPMVNMTQMQIISDNYLNDYKIERWRHAFMSGSPGTSVIDLSCDIGSYKRYLVVDSDGYICDTFENLPESLNYAEKQMRECIEYYTERNDFDHISAGWVRDPESGGTFSHLVLDKQTGEKHFPKI